MSRKEQKHESLKSCISDFLREFVSATILNFPLAEYTLFLELYVFLFFIANKVIAVSEIILLEEFWTFSFT